ncbi:hypothetical protein [Lentisalinibacter orientalis]|uniref:hypothetical protein n=1 Tax=Lentisalinibacter orientalis TaxID=2992241 RepID=UPI00386DBBED
MPKQKSVAALERQVEELTERGYELREAREAARTEENRLLLAYSEGKANKRDVDKATLAARAAEVRLDENIAEVGRLRDELSDARQQAEESERQAERQRIEDLIAERRQMVERAAQAARECRQAIDRIVAIDTSDELRLSGTWYGTAHLREGVLCLAGEIVDRLFRVEEIDRANRGPGAIGRGAHGAAAFTQLETERCDSATAKSGGFDNAA